MADQRDKNNQSVSENIKDGAGTMFHSIHRGLEATENAAMGAVDATSDAVNNLTDNEHHNESQRNDDNI